MLCDGARRTIAFPEAEVGVTEIGPEEARAIAAEAFLFGYPLVLMALTGAVMTNVSSASQGNAPVNQFSHRRAFPDASFTAVVSPNADTLYSTAVLDLAASPIVLATPDGAGRYYLMPLLSAWTDVFASPGTRTTGDGAGAFAIIGPDWEGALPPDVQEIRSPTSLAWLIGRTQTDGKADYASVHEFQAGLSLTPLSAWGSAYSPPEDVPVAPGVDKTIPPPDQIEAMDAATFFARVASLMVANPPHEADAPALARFAAIGLARGSFTPIPELASSLEAGVKDAVALLRAKPEQAATVSPAWTLHRGLGSYGTDYFKRAHVALIGLGANLDEDSIYPHATTDRDGHALNGAHRYRLHFEPGETPPARAFWSLTMYNERQYFVDNPLDRYAIGDRDALAFNSDGSLDLWLQHDSPGPERESNWLPAPPGAFNVVLRVYWPTEEALAGSWTPPGLERVPE